LLVVALVVFRSGRLFRPAIVAIAIVAAATVGMRPGSRIDFEDAHVIHHGGELFPTEFQVARFVFRGGWIVRQGEWMSFLARRGPAQLRYTSEGGATIQLGARAFVLPPTPPNTYNVVPVEVDRDWLETLMRALEDDPKLAAAQTIIRRDEETIDGAGIDIADGTFRQIGSGLALGRWPLAEAWGVSATAAVYRRSAIGERFFDERFFAYYEDVELSARLRAGGWRIAVLPVVAAVHRGSQTAPLLGRRALRLRTRNRYLVARMHPGVGRIRALLWEDARLLLRGRTSIRGIVQGLLG
jgi:hypothetical protein